MSAPATDAYGLVDPDGILSAFAGYNSEAAWAVLGHLLGRDAIELRSALEAKGWKVVPVKIERTPSQAQLNTVKP